MLPSLQIGESEGMPEMEHGIYLNQILTSLPSGELDFILADYEPVTLHFNQSLFRCSDSVDHIFFPLTSVISLVCLLEDGKNVEIGMVGREGLVGLPTVIGSNSAIYDAMVLIPGRTIKVRAQTLRTCLAQNKSVFRQVMCYNVSLLMQHSRLAACNLCHHIPERVCRWLLLMQDRAEQDEFQITHEQIANRLGIRRSGITVQLGQFEEIGAIQSRRGRIHILNRHKLEEIACECYRHLVEESNLLSMQSYAAKASAGIAGGDG
jgi:CRP-like cAMP-binding protein